MALKDKMLVGHVFFMVIRKSIEWSKDSQFQCAKQLAREKELLLCLLQSKQVLIFVKRSLMI